MIYILTRTCNRPKYFELCKESILTQSYTNWKHIVGYDEIASYNSYLCFNKENAEKYSIIPLQKEIITSINTFPYNLYFNVMHKVIDKPGYLIYLDDDDGFYINTALETISNHLDEDTVIIWRVKFPDGLRPSNSIFSQKRITSSGFPSNCFCFHSKWIIDWSGKKGGDSMFFHKICKLIPKKIWLNEILTQINQPSLSTGLGKKNDFCPTTVS